MLNTRDSMREGTNEQTNERMYTMTKHITTLLLRSRVKSTEFFQSVRIFPAVFVRIFEKVIWEHCYYCKSQTCYLIFLITLK